MMDIEYDQQEVVGCIDECGNTEDTKTTRSLREEELQTANLQLRCTGVGGLRCDDQYDYRISGAFRRRVEESC